MKRVLILEYDKLKIAWDVSEKHLRDEAHVDLFNVLDRELRMFEDNDTAANALVHMARAGNAGCCEALLAYRRSSLPRFVEVDITSTSGPRLSEWIKPPTRSVLLPEDVDLTEETN